MSELDNVWHEVVGKQHGHPLGYPCKACDLERQLAESQRCDDCVDSPENIRLPAEYRCYFCDKRFCGPHAKVHFEGDRTSAALAKAERKLAAVEREAEAKLGTIRWFVESYTGWTGPEQPHEGDCDRCRFYAILEVKGE